MIRMGTPGGLDPGRPLAARLAHGVAIAQRVLERFLELGRQLRQAQQGLLLDEREQHLGQPDAARALGHARIAGHASQPAFAREDLLQHSAAQHGNDAPWRVVHDVAVGAGSGADAALDTREHLAAFDRLEQIAQRGGARHIHGGCNGTHIFSFRRRRGRRLWVHNYSRDYSIANSVALQGGGRARDVRRPK